jgi:hypothetical protein
MKAGDYAGASADLDAIPRGDAAENDAASLRQTLDRVLAPRVVSAATALADNQPLEVASAEVLASGWVSPRLELSAQTEVTALRWESKLSGALARASGRVRAGAAVVDLRASVAGRSWSDRRSLWLASAGGELFPAGMLRLQAGARRDEELSTPAAALLHVLKDSAFLSASLHDATGFNAAAKLEATTYSDGNVALLTYGWFTYALLESPLRLDVGYAAAFRDTRESRWNSARGVYFPYTAPLKAFRHGPVAAIAVALWKIRAGSSVSAALVASETDPTTFEWYESRRPTSYLEARGFLRLEGADAGLEASYDHLRDGYYVSHTAKLSSHVVF